MSDVPPPPGRGDRLEAQFEAMNRNLQDIARHTHTLSQQMFWVLALLIALGILIVYLLTTDSAGIGVRVTDAL